MEQDKMIIAYDLDGTLSVELEDWELYKYAPAIAGAIEELNALKEQGHTIIIHTARFEEDREVTIKWLRENKVRYDILVLGKPRADLYVDNNSCRVGETESFFKKLLKV